VDKTINIGPWPLPAGSQPSLPFSIAISAPARRRAAPWLRRRRRHLGQPRRPLIRSLPPHHPRPARQRPLIRTPHPRPTKSSAASIEDLAAAVKTLLDHLGIDKCIMIGHSMGGYITLAFAEKYPDRLTALGLFHSTAYPDSEEKKAIRRKSIEFIRKNGADLFIRQSTPGLFGQYTHQHHPQLIDAMIDRYINFPPDTLIAWYQAMITRPDRTAVLREFHGPVLFIIGEEDTSFPCRAHSNNLICRPFRISIW
jgi:pimeloyl-ACP methyl ester carboxylesterase